jgi:hypothetical protein
MCYISISRSLELQCRSSQHVEIVELTTANHQASPIPTEIARLYLTKEHLLTQHVPEPTGGQPIGNVYKRWIFIVGEGPVQVKV